MNHNMYHRKQPISHLHSIGPPFWSTFAKILCLSQFQTFNPSKHYPVQLGYLPWKCEYYITLKRKIYFMFYYFQHLHGGLEVCIHLVFLSIAPKLFNMAQTSWASFHKPPTISCKLYMLFHFCPHMFYWTDARALSQTLQNPTFVFLKPLYHNWKRWKYARVHCSFEGVIYAQALASWLTLWHDLLAVPQGRTELWTNATPQSKMPYTLSPELHWEMQWSTWFQHTKKYLNCCEDI